MLGFLAGLAWELISYNGFQIPLWVFHALQSASA